MALIAKFKTRRFRKSPGFFWALFGALLLASCSASAENTRPDTSHSSDILLVGNKGEDSLSFIDLAAGKEIARRDTGPNPHEIAISPDGRLAAVVNYGGATIDVFDIAARKKIETISLLPGRRPHGIIWLDDGRIVATTEGSDSLTIVSVPLDEARQRQVDAIATGQKGSHMVVVSPDKSRAFVSNMQSGTVSVLDLETRKKIADLPAGTEPEGLAMTPDGKTLWVADRQGDTLYVFDATSLELIEKLNTGSFPIRVAISPDGKTAATSNLGDGAIGLFDTTTLEPTQTIKVSGGPASRQVTILFSEDGERLYVAETAENSVAEVDLAAGKVMRRFKTGEDGDGLGIAKLETSAENRKPMS